MKIFCDAIYPLDLRLCMIHHKERYLKSKLLFFLVRKSICDVPQGPATCVTIGEIAFPGRGRGGNVTVVNTHYCFENSQQIALLLLKLPHTKTIVLDISLWTVSTSLLLKDVSHPCGIHLLNVHA